MRYVTLPPSPVLAGAVEMFWAYEGYRPPYAFERIFPSGTVEILLNLTDGRLRCHDPHSGQVRSEWSGFLMAGVHHRHQLVETAQQHTMLGIALRPGGAWRLFGAPVSEFTDRHVPLEALLGRDADRLADQVWEIADNPRRLRWLDCVLSRRALRESHPEVAWAADQLTRYPEAARIGLIAEESGLSARRLHVLFQREIGVSPKAFARIRRFQRTLARLRAPPQTDSARLALEMGYADQAHMIREFKSMSGLTPSAYRAVQSGDLNHVPPAEQDQMCPVP